MTQRRKRVFPMVTVLVLMMSGGVFAQNEGEETIPADEAPAPDNPGIDDAAAEKDTPAADKAAPKNDHLPRFRFGVSPAGGPVLGTMRGVSADLTLRFGAQINKMFGVYAQPVALVGAGAAADENNASISGFAVLGTSVMAEAVFLDMIYVGLGPGLLTGGMAKAATTVDDTGSSSTAKASTGPFFEIAARVGVVLGSKRDHKRTGVSLGIDMHTVFLGDGDVAVIPMLAVGFEMF